ncbi:MAG: hypothetical protein K5768_09015 [Firmicutes bacterium]|jgi:hypothetical protein|nr:hypothetical protein [Bacillota bacterium]
MTKENFYDQLTEQYYEYIASLKTMTASELIRNAELIATTKQIYKFIKLNKPFDDGDIEYLSRIKRPLEVIAEVYNEINGIDFEAFDRLMFEGKGHGLFED